jgi:hypothetical protein
VPEKKSTNKQQASQENKFERREKKIHEKKSAGSVTRQLSKTRHTHKHKEEAKRQTGGGGATKLEIRGQEAPPPDTERRRESSSSQKASMS